MSIEDIPIAGWWGKTFFGSGGARLGYVSVIRDVTDRRHAEESTRTLLANVITTQEGERRRIARELDDDMAQTLTSVLVGLRAVEDADDFPVAREAVGVLRTSLAAVLQGILRMACGLRPSILDDLGLEPALELLAVDVAREGDLSVDIQVTSMPMPRLPKAMEIALYRIAEEALSNTGKHAAAKTVSVVIDQSGETVRLVIKDDGRGFDVATPPCETHLGLMKMHERADFMGGSMTVRSSVGRGTTLCVSAPVRPPALVSARFPS